jgi:cytochrome P450
MSVDNVAAAHLLSAIDPATGQPLNDHQVKAEIATFMAAGFETTSHAITWCLTMLVSVPANLPVASSCSMLPLIKGSGPVFMVIT